jgi:PQQ-like domain
MTRILRVTVVLAALAAPAGAQSDGTRFSLDTAGCAMIHCDARLSNIGTGVTPAVAELVAVDSTTRGTMGLGCVSNSTRVACSFMSNPAKAPNLVVYDADGRRLWDDQGQLGPMGGSVPMLGLDGTVIASDSHWILRADPASGRVLWKSAKPTGGQPLSPVPIGVKTSMVLLATIPDARGRSEVSVWDTDTGARLSYAQLKDPATGIAYWTRNTPAVDGNRAYIVANAFDNPADGRLFAIDVCESNRCGGRGSFSIAWQYAFQGPSGASPLLIGKRLFFDGHGSGEQGSFLAVDDLGRSGQLAWSALFETTFVANGAQDPRGGFWVYPRNSPSLLRLSQDTGSVIQEVRVGEVLGLATSYTPFSAVTVSTTRSGAVGLTFTAVEPNDDTAPNYVAAVDVSSAPTGSMLWKFKLDASAKAAMCQFPIVTASGGARRMAVASVGGPTLFIGER